MTIRPYTPSDRADSLAIFRSNVPTFFLEHESAEFAGFLNRLPCPYFVVEENGTMLGCGGYQVDPQSRIAGLDWGMVRRDLHRRGIGRFLLLARLVEIAKNPLARKVALNTSQHSCGFFEREGFVVRGIIPDGYGPGLHRHNLELELDESGKARVEERWAREHSR